LYMGIVVSTKFRLQSSLVSSPVFDFLAVFLARKQSSESLLLSQDMMIMGVENSDCLVYLFLHLYKSESSES